MSLRSILLLTFIVTTTTYGQSIGDYTEFYRQMRLGPLDELTFCRPTDSVEYEPEAIGVLRDTLGRPIETAYFFYGNIDTRRPWSIMKIVYRKQGDALTEERTYHLSNGAPTLVGKASIVEIFRRPGAGVSIRTLLSARHEPVDDSVWVSRAFVTRSREGVYDGQWFISTGKQQKGTGSDLGNAPFAAMPDGTWFRRFAIDSAGNLLWERVYDFDRKPIPFAGGEVVRRYDRDSCGQAVRTRFEDLNGAPMADSQGIHQILQGYDDRGNLVEARYIGVDGRPRRSTRTGAARVVYVYRRFDNHLIRVERYDEQGDLLPKGEGEP